VPRMARWQMRATSTQAIMAATREEESWLIGIAGNVGMNWPRTTTSVRIAERPSTKQPMCPRPKPTFLSPHHPNKPGIPPHF
jgi:hypothetical protein